MHDKRYAQATALSQPLSENASCRLYRLLQEVREQGSWEAWLEFFLDGVTETADQAFNSATRIVDLFESDHAVIGEHADRSSSVFQLHALLQRKPFVSAPAARDLTGLTMPTVNAALETLQQRGIVTEITGRRRGRVFAYHNYLKILGEGAEPLHAEQSD